MGPTDHTATQLLAATTDDAEERSALHEARDFLVDVLAQGPRFANDVVAEARQGGIRERTLRRAKAALGVESQRDGFGGRWQWLIPHRLPKAAIGGQPSDTAAYGHSWQPMDKGEDQ
jgi:hypothetical protein